MIHPNKSNLLIYWGTPFDLFTTGPFCRYSEQTETYQLLIHVQLTGLRLYLAFSDLF